MNSFGTTGKADSLFLQGNYFEAAIEYERNIFYSNNIETTQLNAYKKALCYKSECKYQQAIDELQTIYFSAVTDTLFVRVVYLQAFCFYMNNEPVNAIWKMEEFQNRADDSINDIQFLPLKILCHNDLQEWDKAKQLLATFIEKSVDNDEEKGTYLERVETLYHSKSLPRILKVHRAENLSRFIPGSGQMYAGKVGEGMVNLLINASFLAFAAHQFYYRFYLTGYFAGLGMLNKVYQGGVKRAGILAETANKERLHAFSQEINLLLIQMME